MRFAGYVSHVGLCNVCGPVRVFGRWGNHYSKRRQTEACAFRAGAVRTYIPKPKEPTWALSISPTLTASTA